MKVRSFILTLLAILSGLVAAATPTLLPYQGRLELNGALYEGAGHFKFALLDTSGDVLWVNGGSQVLGQPPVEADINALSLAVSDGFFSVLLGGTTPIESSIFSVHDNVSLRVWFAETPAGPFAQLPNDTRFLPAPYAHTAAEVEALSSSVVLGADNLADGVITVSKFVAPVTDSGQALGNADELVSVVFPIPFETPPVIVLDDDTFASVSDITTTGFNLQYTAGAPAATLVNWTATTNHLSPIRVSVADALPPGTTLGAVDVSGAVTAGSLSGNGSALTGIPINALVITGNLALPINITANAFNGDGSGLTNMNADQFGTITIPDNDPTNELVTGLALNGSSLDLTEGGVTQSVDLSGVATLVDIDDDDADAGNELLTSLAIGVGAKSLVLTDPDGPISVDLTTLLQDADNDPNNELLSGATLNSSTLELMEAGATQTANLAGLINDADSSTTNELLTNLQLSGVTLTITEGGGSNGVNLAALRNDADASLTNELISIAQLNGSSLELNDGGGLISGDLSGVINDADSDASNELQTLSFSGNALSIASGATVTLDNFTALNAGSFTATGDGFIGRGLGLKNIPFRSVGDFEYSNLFNDLGAATLGFGTLENERLSGSVLLEPSTQLEGPEDIVVVGKYAYMPTELSDSLIIIDVSNPQKPNIVDFIATGTLDGVNEIQVVNDIAYCVDSVSDNFTILNVADPLNIVPLYSEKVQDINNSTIVNTDYAIDVKGNKAYIVAHSFFTIFDFSDLNNVLRYKTEFPALFSETHNDIVVEDNIAFIAANKGVDSVILIYDVSDPALPVLLQTIKPDSFGTPIIFRPSSFYWKMIFFMLLPKQPAGRTTCSLSTCPSQRIRR